MNIFILDKDPEKAAEYHCDIHVIKMITETAQLLCNVYHIKNEVHPYWFYKPLTGHSIGIKNWPAKSLPNFNWLLKLGIALIKEYFKRYERDYTDKYFISARAIFSYMMYHPPGFEIDTLTKPVLEMPHKYKRKNPIEAYRLYYIGEKHEFARWKNSQKPYWWPY